MLLHQRGQETSGTREASSADGIIPTPSPSSKPRFTVSAFMSAVLANRPTAPYVAPTAATSPATIPSVPSTDPNRRSTNVIPPIAFAAALPVNKVRPVGAAIPYTAPLIALKLSHQELANLPQSLVFRESPAPPPINPNWSTSPRGFPPTYAYRLSPPPTPSGSAWIYRPVDGS